MRVVLTHPYCWPLVRRGTERNMAELARWLAARGHDVVTLSTHDGPRLAEPAADGRRILCPRPRSPLLEWLRFQDTHLFFFPAARELRGLEADIVHSFYFSDSLAAAWARRGRKYRTVLQLNGIGIPGLSCRRFLPPEGWLLKSAIERADVRITCSRFIGELLRAHYGADSEVIAPPVAVESWPLGPGPADGRPVILSVADFTVRRKGVRALVRAFSRVKAAEPEAVLVLSGRMTPALEAELLESLPEPHRSSVRIPGLGAPGDLPALYQSASVLALPAMWEPSGTVMVEAWACGTPVVATRHAGLPEFMDPEVGVLFDPLTEGEETANVEGLAEAILAGLALSRRPGIRRRCRAHAEKFSTSRMGPLIEKLYAAA